MGELSLSRLTAETDLSEFRCGLAIMDNFIHNELLNVLSKHQNYSGYYLCTETEIVALFVLSTEIVEIDEDTADDMRVLCNVESIAGVKYNSLEILYLAIKEPYRNQGIGSLCIETILKMAKAASTIGIQFLTVDAYKSATYTAVPFYTRHQFIAAEYPNPNNNTLRMIRAVNI